MQTDTQQSKQYDKQNRNSKTSKTHMFFTL